jgi:meso-butanediol dehydrogenase/(S,S)-butanediol dehydrogenase/diacetyl reductase
MSGHQIVLITGAGGGIGAAAARAFAADGHAVAAADINDERLAALAGQIPADRLLTVAADVRDRASVEAMVARTVERFGAIDVLCPNAGVFVGPDRPLEETPDDAIDLLIDVNIRGVVNVLRAGLPHVRPGGAVILTSSISGLQAHPGGAVYAATKTAQLGLARSLAAELGSRRIRVNVISPGTIETTMATDAHTPEQLAEFAEANPLGRLGQPADVAEAFVFLARAAYVNGVVLRVDGGDCLMGAL